ncbi:hypothetical protein ABN056_08990 [Providencia vermicola]|uniref:hypothetical protein n=1 Tax=Providencia TaxID=586 RepID=UPI00234B1727|nr:MULTISPECIES: hypothetical protein [unclassified Providencia]
MKNDRDESNMEIVPRITEVTVGVNSPYDVLVLEITFAGGAINKETHKWEDIVRPAQRSYLSCEIVEHMYAKTGEYLEKRMTIIQNPLKNNI